ncbi:MAG: hypothetical protein AAF604_04540 [Acidobacteriota bacterium]
MRDLKSDIDVDVMLDHGQLTATKTDAPIYDTKGAQGHVLVIYVPIVTTADGSNYFEFKLFEGDDPLLADATEVSADDLLGVAPVVNDPSQAGGLFKFGYRGYKTFLRVQPTENGNADIEASAIVVRGHLEDWPSA